MELVKTREPRLAKLQRQAAHDARPPKYLSAASRRIWREMVAEWDFDGATLVILQTALEARDRMHEAREAIARDESTSVSRPRPSRISRVQKPRACPCTTITAPSTRSLRNPGTS